MISINNLAVRFGGFTLFDDVSVMISAQDKIGLVGRNGAGKSTLLKIIAKQEQPTEGEVVISSDWKVGYLPQTMKVSDGKTVLEEVRTAFSEIRAIQSKIDTLNAQLAERTDYESDSYMKLIHQITDLSDQLEMLGGSSVEGEMEQMLIGLGFSRDDFDRKTSEFSGGWRMRIELVKILLRKPQVLLLDEPTNHLDIVSIQWLEKFLVQYKGAIILISHDRRFLDAITKKTFEISVNKLTVYPAPYSQYLELKEERYAQQLAAYENQQKMIEDTEKFIERFRYKATKSVQVQSRIKQLEKIDRIEIEKQETGAFHIKFPPAPRSGTIVVKAEHVTKRYGEKTVLDDVDLTVERGQKIALVGKNGEGKSTFIKTILNEVEYSGTITLGHNVNVGYFAQNQDEILDENATVFETLDKIAVGEIRTKLRDILGAFFFSGEDVDKKVKVLSGGERNRLAMAKLMLQPYNLLILDEPTNHLDIQSKEVLKQALLKYDGTLILVSHDRDFLNGLTTNIYEVKRTHIKEVMGDLQVYLNQLNQEELAFSKAPTAQAEKKTTASKIDYQRQKEIDRESRKLQTQISKVEKQIQALEDEVHELNLKFIEDSAHVTADDYKHHSELQEQIDALTLQWEELVEKMG
ncbi:MAG: ABC-F family ATP-binding cassette domain-containing protein [Bacteroidales bacterium]|nr:ABC-F family ATP-binding cassette domain-containing protein [Bacteroidales bacterium]